MTTISIERRQQRKLCAVRPLSRPSDFWTKDQMQRLNYAPRSGRRKSVVRSCRRGSCLITRSLASSLLRLGQTMALLSHLGVSRDEGCTNGITAPVRYRLSMSRSRLYRFRQERETKIVAAILTSPVYAATAHPHRAAASVKRPPIVGVVIPKGVFLEDRPVGIGKASPIHSTSTRSGLSSRRLSTSSACDANASLSCFAVQRMSAVGKHAYSQTARSR